MTNLLPDSGSMPGTALETLGTTFDEDHGRDAIHLATIAVTSDDMVFPSQHVSLVGPGKVGPYGDTIGIVDPFIRGPVPAGRRFWLVLYPRTITSLRHVWTHPAFAEDAKQTSGASYSEEWMRRWAQEHMSADYYGGGDRLSPEESYENAILAGRELYLGPYEDARDHIDHEWWGHWEAITGEKGQPDQYFRCAC